MRELVRNLTNWFDQPINLFLFLCSLFPIGMVLWYVETSSYPYPFLDQWSGFYYVFGVTDESLVDVAIKASSGQLSLSDLFLQHTAHRIVFTKLVTAILAIFTQWQLKLEGYIMVALNLVSLLAIVSLFHHYERTIRRSVILVIAAYLLFSMRFQGWIWGQSTTWVFVGFFYVLFLWVLFKFPIRWLTLVSATFFAIGATYSMAAGLVAWPAGLVALWLRGYRAWQHYFFWFVVAAVSIGLYFTNYDMSINTSSFELSVETIYATLAILSTPFVTGSGSLTTPGVILTGFALLLFLFNVLYLWRLPNKRESVNLWVSLSVYALAGAVMSGLGRSGAGAQHLVAGRYGFLVVYFWVALIALILSVIYHADIAHLPGKVALRRPLTYINVFLGSILLALYLIANISVITFKPVSNPVIEACLFNHPVDLEETCPQGFVAGEKDLFYKRVRDLAQHRLALFNNPPEVKGLQNYSPNEPLIIIASTAWQHRHIVDRLPLDIASQQVLHVLLSDERVELKQLLGDDVRYFVPANETELEAGIDTWVGDYNSVWLIGVGDSQPPSYFSQEFGIIWHYPAYTNPAQPLSVTQYFRKQDQYKFGENIYLHDWTLLDNVRAEKCQPVTLVTYWSTKEQAHVNYSMTFVMADSDGVGIIRSDSVPSDVLPMQWQPNWIYKDERKITIPCETSAGEYTLLIGLYNFETLEPLPITTTDENPLGDLLYLTTLEVE